MSASSTSPNFTGCFIRGGKHYARDCPKKFATPQACVEPCPAGAITTLCALRTCEHAPESKIPGSPGAPSIGDKGISTHNMFGAVREEEREEEPPAVAGPELDAGLESEKGTTDIEEQSMEQVEKGEEVEGESPPRGTGAEDRVYRCWSSGRKHLLSWLP